MSVSQQTVIEEIDILIANVQDTGKESILENIKKSLIDRTESERMSALRDAVYAIAFH